MALVLAETVAGSTAPVLLSPLWSEVRRGFFKLTGSILALLAVATWATADGAAVAGDVAGGGGRRPRAGAPARSGPPPGPHQPSPGFAARGGRSGGRSGRLGRLRSGPLDHGDQSAADDRGACAVDRAWDGRHDRAHRGDHPDRATRAASVGRAGSHRVLLPVRRDGVHRRGSRQGAVLAGVAMEKALMVAGAAAEVVAWRGLAPRRRSVWVVMGLVLLIMGSVALFVRMLVAAEGVDTASA